MDNTTERHPDASRTNKNDCIAKCTSLLYVIVVARWRSRIGLNRHSNGKGKGTHVSGFVILGFEDRNTHSPLESRSINR